MDFLVRDKKATQQELRATGGKLARSNVAQEGGIWLVLLAELRSSSATKTPRSRSYVLRELREAARRRYRDGERARFVRREYDVPETFDSSWWRS